ALRNAGRVDMADLLKQSPFEGTAAPFRGEFRPVLPHEFTRAHHLGIVKLSQPLSLNGNRQQAAYRFVLPLRRRQIEGVLLVAPVSSIRNPPPAESFHAPRSAGYGSGGFTTVAWTKGDRVYVCYVRGGGDAMETV